MKQDSSSGRSIMQEVIALPAIPVGKIKSFGPFGPKYEVGQALRKSEDGDWLVEVKMVETGETAEYRLARLLDDPEAR
jgi:hypothetical protein